MAKPLALFIIGIASIVILGCRAGTATVGPVLPACETLSKESVASLQGEQVLETTASQASSGELSISQCFYKLPTYNRSVNLEITSGPGAAIDSYWNKRFRDRAPSEEEEEEREREREAGKPVDEEGERSSRTQPVSGLGDEAFWVASQINGSLFIRSGSVVYRVSLGGPEDSAEKLRKATSLANSFLNKKG